MTLIHSALAGGEWIDDADRLRAGATGQVLGHRVAAPGRWGRFCAHSPGDRPASSTRSPARRWAGPGPPGPWPLTIDLDATHCETYGLHKQGASKVGRDGTRGYHPLLATVAGTGDVVHSRLRAGVANPGRGAASFVTETINRARRAGASGPITLRADSGSYNHKVLAACQLCGPISRSGCRHLTHRPPPTPADRRTGRDSACGSCAAGGHPQADQLRVGCRAAREAGSNVGRQAWAGALARFDGRWV
jgi:hypothetical protein